MSLIEKIKEKINKRTDEKNLKNAHKYAILALAYFNRTTMDEDIIVKVKENDSYVKLGK